MNIKFITKTALLSSLLVLSAWISIPLPFTPVPITLQSLMILLMAATFPLKLSLSAYGLYLLLGSIGLPVFANFRSGFDVLIGPTGGYLLGFVWAIIWTKTMKLPLSLRLLSAQVIIYAFGIAWLAFVLKISYTQALMIGLYPYLIGDLFKLSIVYGLIKKRIFQRFASTS
jgi:biotin transport system substrate-specific component